MSRFLHFINNTFSRLEPKFNRSESVHLAPGLLTMFRLYIGLEFVMQSVVISIYLFFRPELVPWNVVGGSIGYMVALLGYLSWPLLYRKLAHFYLPIGLTIASIAPMIPRSLLIYTELQRDVPRIVHVDVVNDGWYLFLTLAIPMVFVAWQYNFRTTFLYIITLTLLQLLPIYLMIDPDSRFWERMVEQTLTGAVTFTLIGYTINRLIRAQREREEALNEANAKLAEYAATAEQLAVSRERNRMARELHDTLAHTLSAVSVQLEAVDSTWAHAPEKAHSLLLKSVANARSGLAETRRAMKDLRSTPLDDLGLILAVRTMAESAAARKGLKLNFNTLGESNLSPELEQNIYRIAQEAIANVVKHAHAEALTVSLGKEDGLFLLEILDNGKGFPTENIYTDEHYGIQGMQERANLIKATLDVESQQGKYTKIRLILPNLGDQNGPVDIM